jgi:hypothetical protein
VRWEEVDVLRAHLVEATDEIVEKGKEDVVLHPLPRSGVRSWPDAKLLVSFEEILTP